MTPTPTANAGGLVVGDARPEPSTAAGACVNAIRRAIGDPIPIIERVCVEIDEWRLQHFANKDDGAEELIVDAIKPKKFLRIMRKQLRTSNDGLRRPIKCWQYEVECELVPLHWAEGGGLAICSARVNPDVVVGTYAAVTCPGCRRVLDEQRQRREEQSRRIEEQRRIEREMAAARLRQEEDELLRRHGFTRMNSSSPNIQETWMDSSRMTVYIRGDALSLAREADRRRERERTMAPGSDAANALALAFQQTTGQPGYPSTYTDTRQNSSVPQQPIAAPPIMHTVMVTEQEIRENRMDFLRLLQLKLPSNLRVMSYAHQRNDLWAQTCYYICHCVYSTGISPAPAPQPEPELPVIGHATRRIVVMTEDEEKK
jgi:hypothetical protein